MPGTRLTGSIVTIETSRMQYNLDVSELNRRELEEAQRILKNMNYDQCVVLKLR